MPDRDAATVRTWLESHPSIELASRDRASSCAGATFNGVEANVRIDALNGSGALLSGFDSSGNYLAFTIGVANGGGTFSGTVQDHGAYQMVLVKAGTGTQVFGGAGTFSGGTTIEAGTLQIASTSALGTGPVTINDASTGANNTALLATIGSASSIPNVITVANAGTGTTTLGTTTFTGSASTTFSGTLTLNRGVTLQGGNSVGTSWGGTIASPQGLVPITVSGGA